MLYFNGPDVCEKIDVNITSASKEYDIFLLLAFLKLLFQVPTKCMQYLSWFMNDVYEP